MFKIPSLLCVKTQTDSEIWEFNCSNLFKATNREEVQRICWKLQKWVSITCTFLLWIQLSKAHLIITLLTEKKSRHQTLTIAPRLEVLENYLMQLQPITQDNPHPSQEFSSLKETPHNKTFFLKSGGRSIMTRLKLF